MDTITENVATDIPTTDIVTSDEAVADRTNDTFGKEVTKTLLVSIATTVIMTGGVFAASYANEKFKQFRHHRLEKKVEKAAEMHKANVIEMKTQESPTEKD